LGQFVEHLVCAPKIKGLRNLLKNAQPPVKTNKNQHKIKGHNPREELCLLFEQKIKQFGGFMQKLGFGWVGDKMGNLGIWVAGGEWVWWRMAGDGVAVVGEVVGGGWCGWFWI
jgi:hypothetical protein